MTAVVTARVPGTNIRVTPVRVLDAEWMKLRTIRSWPWLTTVTALWLIGSAAVSAVGLRLAQADEGADPLGGALSGVGFTQLLVGTIGILSVTGEYRSGTIRSTFIAVPRRVSVVWGKAAVVALTTLAVTLPTVLIALAAAAGILSRTDTAISPTEPAVLRAVVGASLVLGLTAAIGVAFGWLLRSTAGALTALFGFLVILPLVGRSALRWILTCRGTRRVRFSRSARSTVAFHRGWG